MSDITYPPEADTDRRGSGDLAAKPIIVERRKGYHTPADCRNMKLVEDRFQDGTARMERMEGSISQIVEHQVESDKSRIRLEAKMDENNLLTNELLDIIKAGKGFFKTLGWLTGAVKWVAALAVPLVTLWYAFKDGPHK